MSLPAGWQIVSSGGVCSFCKGSGTRPVEHTLTSPDGKRWPLIGNNGERQRQQMAAAIARANPPRPAYRCDSCGATAAQWAEGWRWFGKLDGPVQHVRCPACPDDPTVPVSLLRETPDV